MNKLVPLAILVLLAPGCSRPQQDRARSSHVRPTEPRSVPVAAARRPTLDPRSPEAAEDLVRAFADLLNTGRLADAYMLLGPGAAPRKNFETNFRALHHFHVTVHPPSDPEGAAGSVYVSVPLTLSGTQDGRPVSRSGKALLRRVNDVPGSTEAQRHWHIERIDWDR